MTTVQRQAHLPATIDLSIYRGSKFAWQTVWLAGDPPAPVDLTGCTVRAGLRDTDAAATLRQFAATITEKNGPITYVDPVTRQTVDLGTVDYWEIGLAMPHTATKQITGDLGPWELDVVYPDASVQTIFRGTITVNGQVVADEDVV